MNKLTYVDNVTVIPASNLNAIQDAINANETAITQKADQSTTYTKTEVDEIIAEVEDGAVKEDGTYDNLTAGSSEALLSDNYTLDREPYIFRKGNGAREYEEIVGGSVGWNQLVQNGDFASTSGWGKSGSTDFSVANNIGTFTVTAAYGQIYSNNISIIAGHKYYTTATAKLNANTRTLMVGTSTAGYQNKSVSTSWEELPHIGNASSSSVTGLAIAVRDGVNGDVVNVKNVMCIDLTALFGSTVADHLYSLEQATAGSGVALFKQMFPKSYYPYNAGSLLSVKTSGRKTVGKNLFSYDNGFYDVYYTSTTPSGSQAYKSLSEAGGWTVARIYVEGATSVTVSNMMERGGVYSVWLGSDDFADVLQSFSALYNNGTKAVPSGAKYLCLAQYNIKENYTSYPNAQVEFGSTATDYEPYNAITYPMSNIDLRGVFKLADGKIYADGDVYSYDGSVTRRYGIVDLGTLTWAVGSTGVTDKKRFVSQGIRSTAKAVISSGYVGNIVSSRFVTVKGDTGWGTDIDKVIWIDSYKDISVCDSAYSDATTFKSAMSGVYLVYELETPTTENADPYQHLQFVGSTEEFLDDRTVQVPVGHNSKYLEDLKAKIEGLPWDLSMIAPIENGTTSSKAYAVGEYFLHNNLFCKAKTSIASGATFTLNTNYTVTTVATELKALQ